MSPARACITRDALNQILSDIEHGDLLSVFDEDDAIDVLLILGIFRDKIMSYSPNNTTKEG